MKNKLSIIHNLYKKNKHVNESVLLNLLALEESKIDYQYILFNDHGNVEIFEDIKEFLSDKVEYIYSDINFGKKMCSGGWLGALPYVKGNLIQNTGQDDVMTALFYKKSIKIFDNRKDIYLTFANGFKTDENLEMISLMINPQFVLNYEQPLECFKFWFGIGENGKNEVTRANNNMPAPSVIYRKELHDLIGKPELELFRGASDFEYWARILFNEYKCYYINELLWLYRMSSYSAGEEIIEGKPNRGYWQDIHIENVKIKYKELWDKKCKQL